MPMTAEGLIATGGLDHKDEDPKIKVFVSYSRRDLAAVDGLARRLRSRSIEALIDRSHIEKFEDWWERIAALIGAADTVIFILSPNAVASEVCQREVDYAASLNKRFAPVLVDDVPPGAVPKALAKLNYVYFRATDDAEQAFEQLVHALTTDIDWVREHTRLGELARRWHSAGQRTPDGADALLLRGVELAEAELWISRRPREAPEPTDLHRGLIQESRKGEQTRSQREAEQLAARERAQRRARVALTGLFALAVLTAAWAAWQARETAKREAKIVTSLAQKAAREGHYDRAMRIALQGLPAPGALPFSFRSEEVEAVLSGAAMLSRLKVQVTHDKPVRAAGFSPDGRRVVTASEDKHAYVWDALSGDRIAVLSHNDHVLRASFNPDGQRIVTASKDGTARLWDAASGRRIATLEPHDDTVFRAVFSAEGDMIVTASYDGKARVWDGATGTLRNTLFGHSDWIWTAVFSPDGQRIVTASKDNTARVWEAASGKQVAVLRHGDVVRSATFSSDGRWIVTASSDKTARLWSAETGVEKGTLTHGDKVVDATFSPDGGRVATASDDKTARLWNVDGGAQMIMRGHDRAVLNIAISADGRTVLTASEDSTARIWDMETGKETAVLRGHGRDVSDVAFSRDGKQIVTASYDGYARIWDADDAAVSVIPADQANALRGAGFIVDAKSVASLCRTTNPGAKDTATLELLNALAKSVPEDVKAWSSADGGRTVLNVKGKPPWLLGSPCAVIIKLEGHEGRLYDSAFSDDGHRVITASADNTARIWQTGDGKFLAVLQGHREHLWRARFSPDGQLIATASEDGTVRLWHAASGTEIAILSHHGHGVRSVEFSKNGQHLETRTDDGTARLWDLNWVTQTGPELRDRVCREKLVGAQVMTNADAEDPILSALKQTNVCERRGPVSLRYWMQAADALRTSAMRQAVYLWQHIFTRATPGE